MDPLGRNRVGFHRFVTAARHMGLHASFQAVFSSLDHDGKGLLSLDDFDPELGTAMVQCQRLLFGANKQRSLDEAWDLIDSSRDAKLNRNEVVKALRKLGYRGPARGVYETLDLDGTGLVTKDEFVFLEGWCVVKPPLPITGRLHLPTSGSTAHAREGLKTKQIVRERWAAEDQVHAFLKQKPNGRVRRASGPRRCRRWRTPRATARR